MRAALSSFDASRLAVLVCERDSAARGEERGSGGAARVSVQELLALARASLAQHGADGVGAALLEGLLTLQPASYLAAALQLALACQAQQERAAVLAMLCRVPTELLPPPVVADALVQLAEGLDGGQLSPPFLPFQLLGRLYRSQHVLRSLQLLVERGPEAAEAAAAAARDAAAAGDLWTVRIGGEGDAGAADADAASAAGAASGSGAQEAPAVQGAAAAAGSTLVLLPLQASTQPLGVLMQRLVGAVLSSLLRRAGGALDATSLRWAAVGAGTCRALLCSAAGQLALCLPFLSDASPCPPWPLPPALSEELLQLLEALFMPAAEEGAWMLEWLWSFVYQVGALLLSLHSRCSSSSTTWVCSSGRAPTLR